MYTILCSLTTVSRNRLLYSANLLNFSYQCNISIIDSFQSFTIFIKIWNSSRVRVKSFVIKNTWAGGTEKPGGDDGGVELVVRLAGVLPDDVGHIEGEGDCCKEWGLEFTWLWVEVDN